MGAAFDEMCKNEGLQSTLKKRNKKIREQKQLILELAKGIYNYLPSNSNSKGSNELLEKAYKIISDNNKKK